MENPNRFLESLGLTFIQSAPTTAEPCQHYAIQPQKISLNLLSGLESKQMRTNGRILFRREW